MERENYLPAAILLFIILCCFLLGCVTVFPKVPSVKDQEEKSCTYYLYHQHYEGRKK